MKRNNVTILITLLALILSLGCASQRLDQFAGFALAGTQYVQAFHKVVAQAGSAMIASDSAVLITARKQAGTGDPNAVKQDDRLLETYLDNLQKIDAHAALLGSYFDAISQLSNGKESASMATAATGLLDSINTFNPQIEEVRFAGKSVKDFVATGTNLVVAHYELKALDEQLHKAAPVIDEALTLQEAAVEAIAQQMRESLAASLEVRESTDVIDPYVKGPPPNWNTTRESYLRAKVTIDDVDHAKTAINQLHKDFRQLVENKRATINLTAVLSEINKMAGYATALESSQANKKSAE